MFYERLWLRLHGAFVEVGEFLAHLQTILRNRVRDIKKSICDSAIVQKGACLNVPISRAGLSELSLWPIKPSWKILS
ncbi:MAG: hypothetical protein RLZZ347_91 [Candidatus Parcubacteria bacterium]|jgi:hypothetical protein